jgi:hypothetical protein
MIRSDEYEKRTYCGAGTHTLWVLRADFSRHTQQRQVLLNVVSKRGVYQTAAQEGKGV